LNKLFLDLHVVQSVPPSCLNRDDTGSPKTAVYGGVRRARVSSQSWKRAMRLMFKEYFDPGELGMRTRYVFDMVANEIIKASPDLSREDALNLAKKTLAEVGIKAAAKSPDKSEALFFMSAQQAKNVAAVALEKADKAQVKKALQENNDVALALFGRMVASDPELNCDASAQVAHAISTHRVENEYDYFTAVDDFGADIQDHAGSGHLGTIEYNSATLYRYATLAVHDLYKQLANDPKALEKAVREFARAFVCSIPTGKQNTFAAHTIPHAVLVSLRADRPLNLVGAFEKPIVSNEGFAEKSVCGLAKYTLEAYASFCREPEISYTVGEGLGELGICLPLENMLEELAREIAKRANAEGTAE